MKKDLAGSGRSLSVSVSLGILLERVRKTTKISIIKAGRRCRDSNLGHTEYEAGVLTTRPRRSVILDSKILYSMETCDATCVNC
jgi:hypothetical protein